MLARLYGKSDIYKFRIEIMGEVKTFDFLRVEHHVCGQVLCQVTNITRDRDTLIGDCKIIGYKDSGVLKNIRTPFTNNAKIEIAEDEFIEKTVGLNSEDDSFIGVLEHHADLRIHLDLKKTITKHLAILAKSGAGKSYTVGVILEEIMRKKIPIIILDPHNEYASIKYPNSDKKDLKRLEKFDLKPHGFLNQVKEFSPDTKINTKCLPVTLDIRSLKPQNLIDSLPQKLSPAQQNILFSILSNLNNKIDLDELIFHISNEETGSKWMLISALEQLKKLKLYSTNSTPLTDLVKYNQASIISLKGVDSYVQETFVAGLLKNLFEARKKEEIPPFLIVCEEAHNFCPERSLGETKSSKVIRNIAAEGRKFGIGLCVISQRPAKVDKNVISQCTTQIILKMSNPNDLRSVISSSEGINSDSEEEIQKLNIGTCLLTGVIDIPLKVNIRPRISKHGGETVDITLPYEINDKENTNSSYESSNSNFDNPFDEDNKNFRIETKEEKTIHKSTNKSSENSSSEFIQHIAPEVSINDAKTMLNSESVKVTLCPGVMIKLKTKNFQDVSLLYDLSQKSIIKNIFPLEEKKMDSSVLSLSNTEKKVIEIITTLSGKFNPAELLLKLDISFNEILRICDTLAQKGFLKKIDRDYELSWFSLEELKSLSFYGNLKFEEVDFDKKLEEKISKEEVKTLFSMFGTIENIKDTFIVKYV